VRESRSRIAQIAMKMKRCQSDMANEEWTRVAPLMLIPRRVGRSRELNFREVINSGRYLVRSGYVACSLDAWETA